MRNSSIVSLCAVALLASTAWADNPGDANPTGDKPGLSENASGAEASLVVQVQREILNDPELAREDIQVQGNERRQITLRGTVSSDRLREHAENVAERVANVQMLENRLIVRGRGTDQRGTDGDSMNMQGRQTGRDVAPDFPPGHGREGSAEFPAGGR